MEMTDVDINKLYKKVRRMPQTDAIEELFAVIQELNQELISAHLHAYHKTRMLEENDKVIMNIIRAIPNHYYSLEQKLYRGVVEP
jgi:hypothetical protein